MSTSNGVLTSPLKTSLRGVYEQAHDNFDAMKERLHDVKLAAKVTGGSLVAKTAQIIRDNPLKAVAASFVAGYIGMRFMRR
jgi:ElaB/YqjD/DUF883 family membrane-anchored ribosome-binding protein